MFRFVLFLLLIVFSIATGFTYGQELIAPLSIVEPEPLKPTLAQDSSDLSLSWELQPQVIVDESSFPVTISSIQSPKNWHALGEDISKIRSALDVLQQELKQGAPLDPSIAFERARDRLRRNTVLMAQTKADEVKELRKLFANLDDLSRKQIGLITSYRNGLTELIKDVAKDRSKDLDNILIYKELANSIDAYDLLKRFEGKSVVDYYPFLEELEASLYDYASAHRDREYREALGQNVARIKAIGEAYQSASANRFVNAINALTRQPNVLLSISEKVINEFIKSELPPFDESGRDVRQCILGTDIQGTADLTATPLVDLRTAFGSAALDVQINGEVKTNTVGYRKPVQIRTVGLSPFTARTQIIFNQYGVNWSAATASASTNSTICSIDKVGGRLFSRIIERVAWRQASKQKSKAEAIGSRELARELEGEINDRLNQQLSKARQFFDQRITPLSKVLGVTDVSSTETQIRLGATYSRLGQLTVPMDLSPPVDLNPSDVTIQIHQSILDQIGRRKLDGATNEQKLAVSIVILDRIVDELFSRGEPAGDSKLFDAIFKSLRNPSGSGGQDGDLSKRVFERFRNLKLSPIEYDQKTEWFTIRGNIKN